LHGGYFDLRALPTLSRQLPVVLTLHDAWLLSGHCAHSFGCERWRTGCGHCPDLTIPPAIHADATAYNWQRKRDIYSQARLYVATPSQWLMDKVEHSMLQQAIAKARVIPNGIDLSVFQPGDRAAARDALRLPQEAWIALVVGQRVRSSRWKDYATMEAAIQRTGIQNSNRDVLFLCLGEKAADQSIGSASMRFVGYQHDPKKLAQFYRAANVYLHAAHADTFPNVILEALACGTPVIATAVGGIPEQIEEGCTGFLVTAGDSAAMAERIRQLQMDESLRRWMSAQAVDSVRQRFCLNRMVSAYLSWYQEILEEARDNRFVHFS
jgi:glycosyltransferase involved in cell wall biosynthesis